MHLLLKNYRLYSFGLKHSVFARYGYTLFLLIFIAIGWYYLVHCNLQSSIENSRANLKRLYDELNKQEKQIYLKKLKEKNYTLNKKWMILCKQSSKQKNSIKNRTLLLTKLLIEQQIFLQNLSIGQRINGDWYTKDTLIYDLKGSYQNMLKFFETLSKKNNCITCKSLQIDNITNNTELQIMCTLSYISPSKRV